MPYKNPDDKKAWRKRNRERNAAYQAAWTAANPEAVERHKMVAVQRYRERSKERRRLRAERRDARLEEIRVDKLRSALTKAMQHVRDVLIPQGEAMRFLGSSRSMTGESVLATTWQKGKPKLRNRTHRQFRRCQRCKKVFTIDFFVPLSYPNGRRNQVCSECRGKRERDRIAQIEKELRTGFAVCTVCGNAVKIGDMVKRKKYPGYKRVCKCCNSKQVREQRRANVELWRQRNRESNKRRRAKVNSNPETLLKYRVTNRMRAFLRRCLFGQQYHGEHALEWLGCGIEQFRSHIENQFELGMSWANASEWHIDHIKPLCACRTEKDFVKSWHYTNLRPLWSIDNLSRPKR